MKTPKKPGKTPSKKAVINKPAAKPSAKNGSSNIMDDDEEDFGVPLDDIGGLEGLDDFDDDDDY